MTARDILEIVSWFALGFATIFCISTRRLVRSTLADLKQAREVNGDALDALHHDILTQMGITVELLAQVLEDIRVLHGDECKEPGGCAVCAATIPALAEAVRRAASFQALKLP